MIRRLAHQWSCATSSRVSTEIGDRYRVRFLFNSPNFILPNFKFSINSPISCGSVALTHRATLPIDLAAVCTSVSSSSSFNSPTFYTNSIPIPDPNLTLTLTLTISLTCSRPLIGIWRIEIRRNERTPSCRPSSYLIKPSMPTRPGRSCYLLMFSDADDKLALRPPFHQQFYNSIRLVASV